MAPGIPIYSVRVLNNAGSGSTASVVCGIDWVTANAASLNIKVANMSLGGGGSDDGNCGHLRPAIEGNAAGPIRVASRRAGRRNPGSVTLCNALIA